MGGFLSALSLVPTALLGIVRSLLFLPLNLLTGKPIRVDIGFIDVVLVSNPDHIKILREDESIARLSSVEVNELPKWVKFYFSGTKFLDTRTGHWFVPFNPATDAREYATRRNTIKNLLSHGYSQEDVKKVAVMVQNNASEDELAIVTANIVGRRFLQGEPEIPPAMIKSSLSTYRKITDALKPGSHKKAQQNSEKVVDFVSTCQVAPGVWTVDASHNIGTAAGSLPGALKVLKGDLNSSLHDIFTQEKNCPAKDVPRISVAASTYKGLLRYASVPKKTVFIMSISKAAGKTRNILFTFGTGVPERSCPFRNFFEAFMSDVQTVLQGKDCPFREGVKYDDEQ